MLLRKLKIKNQPLLSLGIEVKKYGIYALGISIQENVTRELIT
jgi:hypothetical protein